MGINTMEFIAKRIEWLLQIGKALSNLLIVLFKDMKVRAYWSLHLLHVRLKFQDSAL